jgi:hypothetical protein
MSDLLSAASLLLTALTIIYGLWYPRMVEVLEIVPPTHKEDRIKPHQQVRHAIRTRALPLLVISGILTLVFLPDSWRLVCLSLRNFSSRGFASARDYDAIATSFIIVTCLLGLLTAHLLAVTAQLLKLSSKLKW